MAIRSRNVRATIAGGAGTLLASIWSAYANLATAAQLPQDAGALARMLADPPIYLPYLVLAASTLVLAWSLWPHPDSDRDKNTARANSHRTQGPNSPNLGGSTFQGPVTFYPPPAEREPEKAPPPQEPSIASMGHAVPLRPLPAPLPDLPLIGLLGPCIKS